MGGIQEFGEHNIPIYTTSQNIGLLKRNGLSFSKPIGEFDDKPTLNIGSKKIYAEHFGEGHTKDNMIGYFPEDKAIFGGCLIKEVGASKGYLGDANTSNWSGTVRNVKLKKWSI